MINTSINTNGIFYNHLKREREYSYSDETKTCIEETVINLIESDTSINRPGMLLGKIQSGKTRAFIGVAGLAFDNGYDIVVVLTKGTIALAQQTLVRLNEEFKCFIEDDLLQVYDIMSLPDNLISYELNQKLIIVVKKETNNLKRLEAAIFSKYPELAKKRMLIVDDEADFASIGFSKTQKEITEINVIAGQIDDIRKRVFESDFLQVTATPYSLYLQPEDLKIDGTIKTFKPVKPAFTKLVPVPDSYIGGDYYFKESEDEDSIASHIFIPINAEELVVIKKEDRRRFKIEDALTSNKIKSLRHSIMNFIVGGVIRRLQDRTQGLRIKKFSFIIHTEQSKQAHEWQETIVNEIKELMVKAVDEEPAFFASIVESSYNNLRRSLLLLDCYLPNFNEVRYETFKLLKNDEIMITKVNSERDINQLLDHTGELKLRAPLNIFIGGQILDRGITIGNLIGFYYGRNPQRFQQDTVLQHSRMFGYRPLEDLSVTRFYTTEKIYGVMEKIHEFDTGLRAAFEHGGKNQEVIFIQKDEKNKIIPCSPNKLLLSNTTTLKPSKRLLPIGFQTGYKSYI